MLSADQKLVSVRGAVPKLSRIAGVSEASAERESAGEILSGAKDLVARIAASDQGSQEEVLDIKGAVPKW